MAPGPFRQISLGDGRTADLFLLRYDENGRLRSPIAEQKLKDGLADTSDVFLFSHGWNNTFATALDRYLGFITGYIGQRLQFEIPAGADYRHVLVGVMWPSTSYLMPWENGPKIAADADADGPEAAQTEELLAYVTASLGPEADAEFTELIDGRGAVDADSARRAAEIALKALRSSADDDDGSPPPSVDDFLDAWAEMDRGAAPAPADPDDFGTVQAGADGGPRTAAGFSLDPRNLLRMATVWKMKARSGQVGANGVGPLVDHVLRNTSVRLHLIGHSFGARVVLSALASIEPARPARSMLLLQPAVNRWCFAPDVAGTGRVGGYAAVLEQVEQPVLTTFSAFDEPLTKYFHLAVRGGSLGEVDIAAFGEPNIYGALGGFGPAGLGDRCETEPAAVPGQQHYALKNGRKVIAVNGGVLKADGKPAIGGHGDISNPTTWWALHCLTGAG